MKVLERGQRRNNERTIKAITVSTVQYVHAR